MKTTLFAAAAVVAALGSTVHAIELHKMVRLPDDGFGSNALMCFTPANGTGDALHVSGQKNDSSGRSLPMLWRYDRVSNTVLATQLPMPLGFQGGCSGHGDEVTGNEVAVGNLTDGAGNTHAVIWHKPPMGGWGQPQRMFPTAAGSRMARADYCADGILRAVGSVEVNGVSRPVAVELHAGGGWDPTLLSVPSGYSGMAMSAAMGNSGNEKPSYPGYIQAPGGRRIPGVWHPFEGTWVFEPQPIPNGTQGIFTDVMISSVVQACGSLTRNGRTMGIFTGANDGALLGLKPVEGFAHSSAESFWLGSNDALGAAFMTGQSFNSSGPPSATLWARELALDDYPAFRIKSLIEGPTGDIIDIYSFKPADAVVGTAGQCVDEEGVPFASLFLPTQTRVPDGMTLVAGRYGDGKLASLWHDDGDELRIMTSRVGNVRKAVADLRLSCMYPMDGGVFVFKGQFRAESNHQGASGTLRVLGFDYVSDSFVIIEALPLVDGSLDADIVWHEFSSRHRHPVTGEVTLRLEFIQNGNGPMSLVSDMAKMNME